MTARSPLPPAVAAALIDAELKALEGNLRRWRIAQAARRHTGKAFGPTDPRALLERVSARITDLQENTP